ncbi:MAG: hypothetical protein WAN12_13220 [Candidatus Acidiferrum sp.]
MTLHFRAILSTLWQMKFVGDKPIQNEFIVETSTGARKVVVEFAAHKDLAFVDRWRETLGTNPEPKQRETVELAQLAKARYYADSGLGQPYIEAAEDMRAYIDGDPQCEIAGFSVLECDWFPGSKVIGLCHFRRTWCNNMVVDYLSNHPLIQRHLEDPRYKVRGIGTALLCFLSRMAIAHSCDLIWGEATHGSHTYYEHVFELKLESVKDLFVIPRTNFTKCANRKLDWQSEKDVNTMNMEAVRQLYDIEESHPPLVGNRTFMVGPRRQLINHFLELSREVQNEIAQALGLLREGDSNILEDQWCGVLFQRANKEGKLRELWNEVEKRHDKGEPEKNPFVR